MKSFGTPSLVKREGVSINADPFYCSKAEAEHKKRLERRPLVNNAPLTEEELALANMLLMVQGYDPDAPVQGLNRVKRQMVTQYKKEHPETSEDIGYYQPQEEAEKKVKADHNKRTYDHYKALGYWMVRVDHFDTRTNRTHDLLGFGDYMALGNGEIILVQLTSYANMGAREKKIRENNHAPYWCKAGGIIHVVGWKLVSDKWEITKKVVLL